MDRPELFLTQGAPPVNIFTTTAPLSGLIPDIEVTLAGRKVNRPGWVCGVDVHSRCVNKPGLFNPRTCETGQTLITPNWPTDSRSRPGEATNKDDYKIERLDSCKKYRFNPVKVFETYEDHTGCRTNQQLEQFSAEGVAAYTSRVVAELMVGSTNGNPGLAVHATDLRPGLDPVAASTALGALHAGYSGGAGVIVAPWQALGFLADEGIIHPHLTSEGQLTYVDAWGFNVVTDPAITGKIGPPTTPWNQTDPIDPSTDLQTEASDSGVSWVYIAPLIFTGQAEPTTLVTTPTNGNSQHTRGNYNTGTAEAEVIAVFNPCHIQAIRFCHDKTIECTTP